MMTVWVLCLLALLLAGIVQGSSGFGFSLVSVGLVGMALGDTRAGTIVPLFGNLVLTGFMVWRYREHVQARLAVPFLCGSLVGVPLGVYFLVAVAELWINLGLAAVLIGSGLFPLLQRAGEQRWHRWWAGVPLGLFSGSLAGAFNTGGPPAVAFFSNQGLGRFAFVASLQLVFLLAGIVRLGALSVSGLFTREIVLLGLVGVVAGMLGCLLGNAILQRISDGVMRVYICLFQVGLGGVYLWRALA